ncbi:hypothetical protein [Janthinobacterium agaricidamnosum]|uniref:Lipoprotein n=1 Tax=Janthinobacterium agaricidamnosum NBRC 102515 = DSM 9628 TaxID=1349767 RepID=W0V2P0_9BURK|nr:hypothetical protein [Janthinobacterium agaricidamnosum]CDG82146.1 hypothetical protein GJA_1495 [Janthinobacterium agaricidamnosum NBRC 102515 = DSM 9628]
MNSAVKSCIVALALLMPMSAMALVQENDEAAAASGELLRRPQPARLSDDVKLRSALAGFLGYGRGSYTEDDGLLLAQVLEALRSRRDVTRTTLPDGRMLLASTNERAHGRERAALLFDKTGMLAAVGLVNGHCHNDKNAALVCNSDPKSVLTIFHEAGARTEETEPLVSWSRQLPPMLALIARDPETSADGQQIAAVEYVQTHPNLPGWSKEQLPPAFPSIMLPLLLERSALELSAGGGKYVYPRMFAGKPQLNDRDRAEGRPPRDIEVTLRSYAAFQSVVDTYRQRVKGEKVQMQGKDTLLTGDAGKCSYRIRIKDAGDDGVVIIVAGWHRKLRSRVS